MATIDDAVRTLAQQLFGPNFTDYEARLVADEMEAAKVRSIDPRQLWQSTDGIQGLGGPIGFVDFGPQAWTAALDAAERFAADTNWRLFPTMDQLQEAMYVGVDFTDPRQFAQFLASSIPADVRDAMPWVTTGLTKAQYEARVDQILNQWEQLTGDRAFWDTPQKRADLRTMIERGYTDEYLRLQWTKSPEVIQRYGWVKYGMNWEQWRQYKLANREHIVARYGSGAADSDQLYLEDLEKPLKSFEARGTGVALGQRPQGDTGLSEVR